MITNEDPGRTFVRSEGGNKFLSRYEANQRGAINGILVDASRSGLTQEDEVLRHAVHVAYERLPHAKPLHAAALSEFIRAVETDPAAALAAAADAIRWIHIPSLKRGALEEARSSHYRQEHMETQGPTVRQIKFLAQLGYTGMGAISRAEACHLIQQLLDGGAGCL